MPFYIFSSNVRIVTSQRCAMGKSLYVNRLAESLRMKMQNFAGQVLVTIPLHGPKVTSDTLLEFFKDHMKNSPCCIYHIDIASSVKDSIEFQQNYACLFFIGLERSRYCPVQLAHSSWC